MYCIKRQGGRETCRLPRPAAAPTVTDLTQPNARQICLKCSSLNAAAKLPVSYISKPSITVRPGDCGAALLFNVFGPRQTQPVLLRVIPLFVTRLLGKQRPIVYVTVVRPRDFTFVGNVARQLVGR